MRQVPRYLIIGAGRMATHFCHYLTLLKIPFEQWARKTHSETQLNDALSQASHIVVLIKDSALAEFTNKWQPQFADKIWVHFSGQLNLPNVQGAHPLLTYTFEIYDLATYRSIPFVLTQGTLPMDVLLPNIPNASFVIPSELKTYYHAMCVISGNFTCLVWEKMFKTFTETLNLPPEVAVPYFKQITQNILKNPYDCLTGPLARGDQSTIQSHLKALNEDDFLPIYHAVLEYFKNRQEVTV